MQTSQLWRLLAKNDKRSASPPAELSRAIVAHGRVKRELGESTRVKTADRAAPAETPELLRLWLPDQPSVSQPTRSTGGNRADEGVKLELSGSST